MTEESKRFWDVLIGVFAPILTICGILLSVYQFSYAESHRVQFEHDSKLWADRVASTQDIANRVGKVVAHAGRKDFLKYTAEYDEVYYGPSLLIQDSSVEAAMVEFKAEIGNFLAGRSQRDQLVARGRSLIAACRFSVENINRSANESRRQLSNLFGWH